LRGKVSAPKHREGLFFLDKDGFLLRGWSQITSHKPGATKGKYTLEREPRSLVINRATSKVERTYDLELNGIRAE
jgi:hypothetical protein